MLQWKSLTVILLLLAASSKEEKKMFKSWFSVSRRDEILNIEIRCCVFKAMNLLAASYLLDNLLSRSNNQKLYWRLILIKQFAFLFKNWESVFPFFLSCFSFWCVVRCFEVMSSWCTRKFSTSWLPSTTYLAVKEKNDEVSNLRFSKAWWWSPEEWFQQSLLSSFLS